MSDKPRKFRKCPHCKGVTGFRFSYMVTGSGHEDRNWKGEVIDAERNVYDSPENYGECLDCGRSFEIENCKVDL